MEATLMCVDPYEIYKHEKACGRIRLVGEPEHETVEEHGGDCPEGYVTVVCAVNYGRVGYIPETDVKKDDLGYYFYSKTTPFQYSGGR